ncbi:MAG: hypothetical protein GWP14_00710 [Actinobacteria bacterium]|nr:hypothetical protein [Actinomycetota bacterium]
MREEQRESWGSRPAFVLAAVGSAVGLGNLWGFPYKLYSHGGGAFLIPYVIAMLLVGLPLLIAEFSLGHLTQRATPEAFGRVNRRFAFVGWWQIILSFVIITYYAVILAWCLSFLYYSVVGIFQGALPWAGHGLDGVEKAKSFFEVDYLGKTEGFTLGNMRWHIVGALVITWLAMYFCIFRGVRMVSKVVMWTVPLPFLMLLILTIRGLTLNGAMQGLEYYLEPDWGRLTNPATWRWAFGQMFFSMSLAFGVMITYASFLHRKSDLNNNAAVIGLADIATSFLAGLAVFATLGGMAYASARAGSPVPVEAVAVSGPGLAFVAFPYALAQLPHAAWFSLIFFASLLLLGIDSAFSITESVLASIVDKTGWSRGKTLVTMSVVGLLVGLVFCTQGGLSWLGTFDDFINGTWGITLTALLECLVLGWLFRLRRLREHANEHSDWRIGRWWDWSIRVVIPMVLAALFAWSLFDSLANPKGYVFDYKAEGVAVQIPANRRLPQQAMLELQFTATFSGKAEHTFVLDTSDPTETSSGWKTGTDQSAKALPEDFKRTDVQGKALLFSTDSLTPQTAFQIQYRWSERSASSLDQPQWIQLGRITTNSSRQGVNVGNAAGLCLMAVAPILAIIITSVRMRGQGQDEIDPETDQPIQGTASGILAILLGLAGIVLLIVAFVQMLGCSAELRGGMNIDGVPVVGYLIVAGISGLLALLIGGLRVLGCERSNGRCSLTVRLGSAMGIMCLGVCGGLALAFAMLSKSFPAKAIEYDNQLSGVSYVILGCMLGIIVVGLGLCFYWAIKGPQTNQSI